jgi:hypothetical protein
MYNEVMVSGPRTTYQRLLLPRTSAELRRDLEKLARRRIDLDLATSRRTVLSSRPQPCGRILLRAHPMFLYAPESIVRALAKVVANPLDRSSSKAIDDFIAGESDRLSLAPSREKIRTRGRFFDLRDLYRDLQAQLFEPGEVKSRITWGRGPARE